MRWYTAYTPGQKRGGVAKVRAHEVVLTTEDSCPESLPGFPGARCARQPGHVGRHWVSASGPDGGIYWLEGDEQ